MSGRKRQIKIENSFRVKRQKADESSFSDESFNEVSPVKIEHESRKTRNNRYADDAAPQNDSSTYAENPDYFYREYYLPVESPQRASSENSSASKSDQYSKSTVSSANRFHNEHSNGSSSEKKTVGKLFENLTFEMRGSFQQLLDEIRSSTELIRSELAEIRNEMHQRLDEIESQFNPQRSRSSRAPVKPERHSKSLIDPKLPSVENLNIFSMKEVSFGTAPEKICTKEDFDIAEARFRSKAEEDIEHLKQMVCFYGRMLNENRGYNDKRNSLMSSLLTAYFDEDLIRTAVGWNKTSYFINLKENTGHVNFFFHAINARAPNSFESLLEVQKSLNIVLKRLRDGYRKTHRKKSRKAADADDSRDDEANDDYDL